VNESHKIFFQMMIIHSASLSSQFYRYEPEIYIPTSPRQQLNSCF